MTLGEGRDNQVGGRAEALPGRIRTLFNGLYRRPPPHYKSHRLLSSSPTSRMHPSGRPQEPRVPAVPGACSPRAGAPTPSSRKPEGAQPRRRDPGALWGRGRGGRRAEGQPGSACSGRRRCHILSLCLLPPSPASRSRPGCAASPPAEAARPPAAPGRAVPAARRVKRPQGRSLPPGGGPARPLSRFPPGPPTRDRSLRRRPPRGPPSGTPQSRPELRPPRASADTCRGLRSRPGTRVVDSTAERPWRVTEPKTRLPPRPRDALATHWLAAEGWAPIAVGPPSAPPAPPATLRRGPNLPPRLPAVLASPGRGCSGQ